MAVKISLFVCFLVCFVRNVCGSGDILCETGFCRNFLHEESCATTSPDCGINNATHTGMHLPSPSICNCCDYCLPLFGANEFCSRGGPGTGVTVGRCGDGLTCMTDPDDGLNYCRRMVDSTCHKAQDSYDERHDRGETGALEQRPSCDGKGKFAVFDCVPAHTCFCQSEDGERLFGEVLNLGATTTQNMHCGCSRFHDKIQKTIGTGVRFPVIGPRCRSDGSFYPVQCLDRICYCVDRITGEVLGNDTVDLTHDPISELRCYDETIDLFPEQSRGTQPFDFTTPCFEEMAEKIEEILESEEDGFNVDFFNDVPRCFPDGTYGRIATNENGTKICIDERRNQIEDYKAEPGTPGYEDMDCKCAQTNLLMSASNEQPVCCKNGNFRPIQCRRGLCRCVDFDGRQTQQETSDVTALTKCYTENWRDC